MQEPAYRSAETLGLPGQREFGLGLAALRMWYVNTGHRYGAGQGRHHPNWGLRIQSSLFIETPGSLTFLAMVLVPTPTFLQLERGLKGKGINSLSPAALVF